MCYTVSVTMHVTLKWIESYFSFFAQVRQWQKRLLEYAWLLTSLN